MDSLASRRHRSRCSTPVAWIAVLVAAAALGGCDAVVCSQSQQGELTTLVDANKSIFQACGADLKLSESSTSSDTLASFIHEDYLQDTNADRICASDNCVRALIQAMENLPDCCSQVASATRNLPRLADDILHQCDVRDAKKLASELEAEIAKLPDLKVQIKSLGTGKGSSVSGSGDSAVVGDGVDVIIDVKKRELMKTGGLGLTPSDGPANSSSTVAASSNSASDVSRVSTLLLAVCTAVQLLLWQ